MSTTFIICFILVPVGCFFSYWMICEGEATKHDYEGNNSGGVIDNSDYLDPIALCNRFMLRLWKNRPLSKEERSIRESLRLVQGDGFYSTIIRDTLGSGSRAGLRELIETLLIDINYTPIEVLEMVGKDTMDKIINLRAA